MYGNAASAVNADMSQKPPEWACELKTLLESFNQRHTEDSQERALIREKLEELLSTQDKMAKEIQPSLETMVQKAFEEIKEGQARIADQVRDNLAYRSRVLQPFIRQMERNTREIAREAHPSDEVMADEMHSEDELSKVEAWLSDIQKKKLAHFNHALDSLKTLGPNTLLQTLVTTLRSLQNKLPYGTCEVDAALDKLTNPKTYLFEETFTVFKSPTARLDISVKSVGFPITHVELTLHPHVAV